MDAPLAAVCPNEEVLAAFVEGVVAAEERRAVEEHLDGCVACRDVLAGIAETFVPAGSDARPTLFGRVGRYELLEVIGRGAMGTVYEARDPVLERRVAVKVIESSTDEQRLLREGRAMARVEHPNVVAVHDAGVDEGRVYIAMDLVRGVSLREHLRKHPELGLSERVSIFIGAARGLAAAHASNVVHRDFKPENIVIGGGGRARVTDFGLARPFPASPRVTEPTPDSIDERWLTDASTRGLGGTPAYVCPELLDGEPVDERGDQFSFGIAMYEALFHVHPFGIGVTTEPPTLARVRSAMKGPLRRPPGWRDLPAHVWMSLERALAERPGDRWPSMAALADALQGPDERTQRRLGMLMSALVVTIVVHVLALAFLAAAAVALASEPPEPPDSTAAMGDAVGALVVMVWTLGFPLAVASAWGLGRQRRWAYATTALYALLSLPSVLGTPFACFAAWVLTRSAVRRHFGQR